MLPAGGGGGGVEVRLVYRGREGEEGEPVKKIRWGEGGEVTKNIGIKVMRREEEERECGEYCVQSGGNQERERMGLGEVV